MLSCALIHIFRSLLVSCLNFDRLCLVIVLHALWTRLARFLCGSMQNLNQESFVVDDSTISTVSLRGFLYICTLLLSGVVGSAVRVVVPVSFRGARNITQGFGSWCARRVCT